MGLTDTFAHPDPVIRQVLDIWLPRFVRGGVSIGDLADTVDRMSSWDDWGPEWSATARSFERDAEQFEQDGRVGAATAAWDRAFRCHHLSYFLSLDDEEAHEAGLRAMLAAYERARPNMQPAVEKVEIAGPDGLRMVGLLSLPEQRPAPVVIVLPGLDSTKETRHGSRATWTARGIAALSLDGPGQGEAGLWSTTRPDYEVAISAAIDWIEGRPDLDGSRVGLFGSSLGGYYAARAAALEPRVTAAVENCGPYDWGACWDGLPEVTRKAFTHHSGAADMAEAGRLAEAYTLDGVMGRMDRPLMVVHGGLDPLIPPEQGARIADESAGETVFNLVERGNHGVNDRSHRWLPDAVEWLSAHVTG